MRSLKIYVASPYTPVGVDNHDAVRVAYQNARKAIRVGIRLMEKGHIPFVPQLTHFIHIESEVSLPKEFYYKYDMQWLDCCDAILFLGSSEGTERELARAKSKGLIVFKSLKAVPVAKKN